MKIRIFLNTAMDVYRKFPRKTDGNESLILAYHYRTTDRRNNWIFNGFFLLRRNSPGGPMPPHYRGFVITLRHTTLGRTPLDEWSARRRPLHYNTQHSQETTSMPPCGIETHNPSKRSAADPRLIPRGHWEDF